MKKIKIEKDEWGEDVIYVGECDKFKYEIQPDLPKLNYKMQKQNKVYIKNGHLPDLNKFDIME